MWKNLLIVLSALGNKYLVLCDIEYNILNNDGSFAFRHSNNDIGSYHHTASGSPDKIVQGRYGSRNPINGQVEDTVYSAGPQGFRANGPQIHRKMNLAQFPRDPFYDPNNDPNNLPTYSFNFRTPEQERVEDTDSAGRTRGLYSYLDDIGESHTVRYAAGAGTGFQVLNAVPDTAASVAYNAPLYKAPSRTRGKMATELGPNGQYKFIVSGPDHRRSESVGPDGITRGSYSYLDDKGIQRTVEYIAGAGIGYRVIQNIVGRGTHLNLKPALPPFRTETEFRPTIKDNLGQRTRFMSNRNSDNNSNDGGEWKLRSSNRSDSSLRNPDLSGDDDYFLRFNKGSDSQTSPGAKLPGKNTNLKTNRGGSLETDGIDPRLKNITLWGIAEDSRGKGTSINDDNGFRLNEPKDSSSTSDGNDDYNKLNQNRGNTLEITSDLSHRSRDSTIIKNVGKWYIGLPPGQAVRAHIQNIDLLPYGGRIMSPSEALLLDELKKSLRN